MKNRFFQKDVLGIIILAAAGITALALSQGKQDGGQSRLPVSDVKELEPNEIGIELIGEDSQMESPDFYLVETSDNSRLFCDIDAVSFGDEIYLFVDEKTWLGDSVKCDVMTVWDERITSLDIDLSKNNYINGHQVIPVYNTLPIVNISAVKEEFNEMKDYQEKGIICSAKIMTENAPKGIEAQIKGRGNASWDRYYKRPYSLTTMQSYNTFGIGKQKKWNLLANAHDKTLLKNEIFFELARQIGLPNTPESELVHLFINGGYLGIYEVTTKIKEDETFMPLASSDFLVNIGGTAPEQRVEFDAVSWDIDSDEIDGRPYADVVFPKDLGETRKGIITDHLADLFAAIDGADDEALGKMIDLESMAKLYWVEEISMNTDAGSRSLYMQWDDSEGKFFAGPLWDMDYTLGAAFTKYDSDFSTPQGWKVSNLGMWRGLMSHECFRKSVKSVYEKCDLAKLMQDSVDLYRERSQTLIPEASLDYMEHIDENQYDELDRDFTSYETYTGDTIDFYQERVDWIKGEMASGMTAGATIE